MGHPEAFLSWAIQDPSRPPVRPSVWSCPACSAPSLPRDALEGMGPQRRPQKRVDRRLEEVAKAVGGRYCRLQMPLKLVPAVRDTVAGHRLGALEGGGGGGAVESPPSSASLSLPRKDAGAERSKLLVIRRIWPHSCKCWMAVTCASYSSCEAQRLGVVYVLRTVWTSGPGGGGRPESVCIVFRAACLFRTRILTWISMRPVAEASPSWLAVSGQCYSHSVRAAGEGPCIFCVQCPAALSRWVCT